jgi:glycosyltransferase involved in cell wall biosynthesis
LYQQACCFVFPSRYEGFGLPPLEAMACGCPVVASDAASLPEVCGGAAAYVDPNDPMQIADTVTQVIEDAALRLSLQERGREHVAKFRWVDAAVRWFHLLGELS